MGLRTMWLGLTVAGLIAVGGPALLQDRLLYFPAKATVAELEAGGLQAWPTAKDFRGLVAPPVGQARATAVVFHGNAGHAGHRDYYAAALSRLGVRVILAEYPGYGPRGGDVGEAPMVDDAAATLAQAYRAYGPPLLVIGESLGAGVAAAAAARQHDQVAGLLLITPWDRLQNVASHHYPWLPVRWLLRDPYDSIAHLADWHRPVVVAVAEHDRIVPPRFGQALYEALPEPKRLLVVASAGHNDWAARVDKAWWEQVVDFLLAPAAPPR
ncbi:MAG TPA: alpha/beta hydrolase [Rubrivivax sp.]|jgi:pimeloyl-ACP methyl ester carboxylesterase|nr:alpha/beta hydrolase [Rubrivivax sp.]